LEDERTKSRIMRVGFQSLSVRETTRESAEVRLSKNDFKISAYENRTKSAKCGGLETRPRERISGPSRLRAVRRFVREGLPLLALSARQNLAENVGGERK
jgi:hypothetical protein